MWTDLILERIGYVGPLAASVSTLSALQRQFLFRVPFENLDIHLGRPIRLEREQVLAKVVNDRRGGWCFELNEVFRLLLTELGFDVTRAASTVLLDGGDAGEPHPFDHLTLIVTLEGQRWLTDVGFGDCALAPLDVDDAGSQTDEQGEYRISPRDGLYLLERLEAGGAWNACHRFDPAPRQWADFAERCQFLQRSPRSKFTQKRLCTRLDEHGCLTLSGNHLIRHTAREPVPESEYRLVLDRRFDLDVGDAKWIRPG